jgi:hypothetical protein
MVICIDGHCYDVVVIDLWPPHRPGPGPVNYPQLFYDATLVASVQAASEKAQDEGVRAALQSGIDAAIQAMQSRAADGVKIRGAYPES